MRLLFFSFLLCISVISCNNPHSDVYSYQDKAYVTQSVSDFEMSHFKRFASDKAFVLSDKEWDSEVENTIKEKCKANALNCQWVSLHNYDDKELERVEKLTQPLEKQKFLVISLSPEATAFFVGYFAKSFYPNDYKGFDQIFTKMGLATNHDLKKVLHNKKKVQ